MSRSALIAACLALGLSPTAVFAQEHGAHAGHDAHGAHAAQGQAQAHHGHQHADFTSGRFHVRVEGQGPDIILIPGLSSSPEVWQGTVDYLAGRYRVHRVHIQGFAGAPPEANAEGPVSAPVAEDLARYIAEQNLVRPTVVGHSMGGTIAMMLAARHPASVGKVMVVDMVPFLGAMFGSPGSNPTPESVTLIADQIYAGMANGPREAYDQQASAQINGMIRTEALRAGALGHMRASDQKVSAAAYRELIVTDLRPELAGITAPTRVLYVAFDFPGMTPEMADGIYRGSFATLPGVTLKRIPDSAHFIMFDQPEVFHAELDAFLSAE